MNLTRTASIITFLFVLFWGCAFNGSGPKDVKISESKKQEDDRQSIEKTPREISRDGRFVAYDNETVKDTVSGLIWAAKDNGKDITWSEAKKYCENYKGGGHTDWRMPTLDELAGIYDPAKKNRHGYLVTGLIEISACCPWPSDTVGSQAAVFSFSYGGRYWLPRSCSFNSRALPVRDDK